MASTDIAVVRYGGSEDSPEGGEALFLADATAFDSLGPPGGIDVLDRYESDTLTVRVSSGELHGGERDEWITRRAYAISAPSGRLVLGSWFPDHYGPDAPYEHPPWSTSIGAPDDLASVVVYTHLPFLIARGGLIEAMSMTEIHDQLRPWGRWFRENRPGEPMPDWLAAQCVWWPTIDPGHESEWEGRERPDGTVVEVVLQLLRAGERAPADAKRELGRFPDGIRPHLD